ncbi:MAG: hypothetical protein R3F38_18860 [Gammaproteobacteria bacterium]
MLHLGCGLGNGLANLPNARKGKVPVVNIVGDPPPITAGTMPSCSPISKPSRATCPGFVRTSKNTTDLCKDAADAITAARGLPSPVATLILPADVSWGEGGVPVKVPAQPAMPVADDAAVQAVATAIRSGKKTALLLGGHALRGTVPAGGRYCGPQRR